jgi:hypothetical protein
MKTATDKGKRKRRTQDDIEFDPGAGAFQLKGACRYLGGIAPITMRRLIACGKITPNRQLRHLLFPRAELDRFLNEGV